jgi:hypothetical protein
LQARQTATAKPEMPAPIMVMLSEMGKGKDIGWIRGHRRTREAGNISHEGADVAVVDA